MSLTEPAALESVIAQLFLSHEQLGQPLGVDSANIDIAPQTGLIRGLWTETGKSPILPMKTLPQHWRLTAKATP